MNIFFKSFFWSLFAFYLSSMIFMLVHNPYDLVIPNSVDPAADTYISGTSFVVRVHLYGNPADLQNSYIQSAGDFYNGEQVSAFSITFRNRISKKITECDIHVKISEFNPDPKLSSWGHELKHCIYGKFHDKDKK